MSMAQLLAFVPDVSPLKSMHVKIAKMECKYLYVVADEAKTYVGTELIVVDEPDSVTPKKQNRKRTIR